MAQIIKHRRGSIGALKDVTANVGELVMATGSIGDLNAPVLFIGESAIAGGYKPVSKIYQGASAPTLGASYGSTMDGTPFYSNNSKTLYILDRTGNIDMDLTGNIEGNTISAVTINNITGSTAYIANISGSFTGSGIGLYDIPATGITGLNLSKIYSGSVEVNTDSVTGDIHINADDAVFVSGATFNVNATSNLTGSVNISGDTSISGNQSVDYVKGYTDEFNYLSLNGNGIYGQSGVELSSTDNISLWSEGGNINVTGSMKVTGDVTVEQSLYVSGNIYQTGSFYTQGSITLSGSINLGDSLTGDTINFGGEVSSSILPQTHNVFDLGSPSKNWRNLHISGTAYVDTLEARQVNFSDLGILQDLSVSGNTYLGNGGDITVISGSVYNDQLTDNRVLVAGPNGLIEDSQYFTYDEVTLRAGAFEVDIMSGDTRMSGSLLVKNGATVTGSFKLNDSATNFSIVGNGFGQTYLQSPNGAFVLQPGYGGIEVIGDNPNLKVGGTLQVNGATKLNSTLDVTGSVYIANDLSVSGSVTLGDMSSDNTIVSGTLYTHNTTYLGDMNTSMGDALIVSGGVKVRGTQVISDDLIVSGNVYLGDTISDNTIVSGTLYTHNTTNIGDTNTLFGTALIVSGAIKHVGDNIIDGNLIVSGNINLGETISDNTVVSGTLYTHNTTYIGDTNTLFGTALIISGGVKQVGDSNIDGDVSITGSLITDGITNNGDLTVNGVLTVTGNTQLQSNLYVSGNLEVLGSSTNVNIQSTTVEIGDNIILVNAYSPFQRYAGITGYDSGSVGNSGSMLWDSLNNFWLLQNSDASTSKVIGTTSGSMGSEVSLTDTYFPIATGANTIGDSLLRYSGTTLSFNTNKFTIDSGTGETAISGNLILSYSGGTDGGSLISAVMFRNSDNVVGYVGTADSQVETTQLLGYKTSDGTLTFSSVIDGGGY